MTTMAALVVPVAVYIQFHSYKKITYANVTHLRYPKIDDLRSRNFRKNSYSFATL